MTEPTSDRPLRGRRLSAAEFRRLTGRELKADNENQLKQEEEQPNRFAASNR